MLGHPVRHHRQPIIHKLPTTRLNYVIATHPVKHLLKAVMLTSVSKDSMITSINKLTQQVKGISNSTQALFENYFKLKTKGVSFKETGRNTL